MFSKQCVCFLSDNPVGYYTDSVTDIRNESKGVDNITNDPTDTYIPQSNFAVNFSKNIINKVRRRLYWEMFEIDRDNYRSFKEFKQNWEDNLSIRKEIKNVVRADYDKFIRAKNTAVWFLNRRKPRNPRW